MKILKKIFSRMTFIILFALIDIYFLVMAFGALSKYFKWLEGFLHIAAVIIVLNIIRNSRHLSSDMMWLILIMLFPIAGTAMYLFAGTNLIFSRTFRNLITETDNAKNYYKQDPDVLNSAFTSNPEMKGQFRYISEHAGFPFYRNTGFDYYPLGDEGYPVMLEEIKKAKKFIFLEYFIIEPGQMWDGMLELFEQKVREGVEVRVMYDDLGSLNTLPGNYKKRMQEKGIKCTTFNRINPILGIIMNHRDHRKIMVIDGRVAFSGGVNLADEYINTKVVYGHWKDNIIRITGEAVWSYTVMFLTNWNALNHEDTDYTVFKSDEVIPGKEDGFIAAYGETPLDSENVAQDIYMNILNQANSYCYIMTPYLIIDTEFINALTLAAQRGVDVRLITPGIPDKKIIWDITRSYYSLLLEGGVKIYEYTPGFIHAKVFVSDDICATVGTVNLDYRSLYLHFENGTYLYGSEKVADIKQDFLDTCAKSQQIGIDGIPFGLLKQIFLSVVRIFAPLM